MKQLRNTKPGVISAPYWVVDLMLASAKPISSAKLYRSPIGGNRGEREAARAEMQVDPAALTNLHRRAVIPLPSTDAATRDWLPMEACGEHFGSQSEHSSATEPDCGGPRVHPGNNCEPSHFPVPMPASLPVSGQCCVRTSYPCNQSSDPREGMSGPGSTASGTLAAGNSLTDPVPAESRDTLDAGSVSTVAVIEGLEKQGNAGVSLTGAMTLSAPAFAIR